MAFFTVHELASIFGLLGNIISFLVFLAPVPTFYKIVKNKSSEGYQSIPYIVALCSAMLLLYYAFLKSHAYMIVGINAFGCAIEITYLIVYIVYAPMKQKRFTMKLILVLNVGAFCVVALIISFLIRPAKRVTVVGYMCAAYNIAVFAAPLSIMRRVIRTKSVEYMPFLLSLFLTLCATSWFFYGFFIKDYFIAMPNTLGFLFGIAQMLLYFIYKDDKKKMNIVTNPKQSEGNISEIKLSFTETANSNTKSIDPPQTKEMLKAVDNGIESNEKNV